MKTNKVKIFVIVLVSLTIIVALLHLKTRENVAEGTLLLSIGEKSVTIDISKFDEYLDLFDKELGLSYIKCIHINDSKNNQGSHKDRHENFGFGELGFDNLINIIYNERLKDIPKILETPYVSKDGGKDRTYPPYKFEIEMIRNKKYDENYIENIRNYYR